MYSTLGKTIFQETFAKEGKRICLSELKRIVEKLGGCEKNTILHLTTHTDPPNSIGQKKLKRGKERERKEKRGKERGKNKEGKREGRKKRERETEEKRGKERGKKKEGKRKGGKREGINRKTEKMKREREEKRGKEIGKKKSVVEKDIREKRDSEPSLTTPASKFELCNRISSRKRKLSI